MPDLDWNSETWNATYDWGDAGEEWSQAWGGSEAQWFGSLFPRLHRFLPAHRILEIAPGFGRWTKFLTSLCNFYVGVDLSERCVAACEARFAAATHACFKKNDGTSLDMVEGQFDFVFSFDSLVHAEADILRAYIPQILDRLSPTGVAFIHHSNFHECRSVNTHCRAASVSAKSVAELVLSNHGEILLQEKLNWGSDELTDCLTIFRPDSGLANEPVVIENANFMTEANVIKNVQSQYCLYVARPHKYLAI